MNTNRLRRTARLILAVSAAYFLAGTTAGWAQSSGKTAASKDQGTPPQFDRIARLAIAQWLIPGYQDFLAKLPIWQTAVSQQCRAPSPDHLKAAQQQLSQLQLSWARVSMVTFGPLGKDRRQYRMYFWPDKHGTGSRQFRKTMAAMPSEFHSPKSLSQQSVALQGLGAAEKLLFGSTSEDLWAGASSQSPSKEQQFACKWLGTMAVNMEGIAKDVVSEWQQRLTQPPAAKPSAPAAAGEVHDNRDELYYKLLKVVLNESELTAFVRLGKVLGTKPEKAKPKLAEAYRQQLSIPIMIASLQSLQQLLLGSKTELSPQAGSKQLDSKQKDSMQKNIAPPQPAGQRFEGLTAAFADQSFRNHLEERFARTLKALDAIEQPLAIAVKKDWQKVQQARFVVNDLVTYLTESVALKAGIVFSFNELDGD